MDKKQLDEVIAYFGSQKELAKRMGISEASISLFINKDGFPAFRAIQIEMMSEGRFKAVDLIKDNRFYNGDDHA